MDLNFDWKTRFPSAILNRGRSYFRNGQVLDYQEDTSSISGYVQGSQRYIVRMSSTNGNELKGYCTCPAYDTYGKCKHMAAVLFRYDQEHEEGFQSKPNLVTAAALFDANIDRSNLYYNLSELTGLGEISVESLDEAKNLADQGKVHWDRQRDLEFSVGRQYYQQPETCICALTLSVNESVKRPCQEHICAEADKMAKRRGGYNPYYSRNSYKFEIVRRQFDIPRDKDIRIEIDRNQVRTLACGVCGDYHMFPSGKDELICSHIGAALILLDRYLYRYNPGDETSLSGERFLRAFSMREEAGEGEERKKDPVIHLEPRIEWDYRNDLKLSFRIGAGTSTDCDTDLGRWKITVLHDFQKRGTKAGTDDSSEAGSGEVCRNRSYGRRTCDSRGKSI